MALIATQEQKEQLNERGFFVIESLLSPEEVAGVAAAMDEVEARVRRERNIPPEQNFAMRNGLVEHPAILDLLDRSDILSYIVDVFGWNIQNRDSVLLATDADPGGDPAELSLGWHFDYEEEFAGATGGGLMPWLDFKVGWYLSDLRETGHATILLVPGSHRWDDARRANWQNEIDPDDIFELRAPAGSAMLWRPTLLHAVTPNLSSTQRKAIYISYTPRWVRPTGHIDHSPELLARSNPIRRQLLGAMGDLSDPMGSDPRNNPECQYWFTQNWATVPLRRWAEERHGGPPFDWGTGYGVSTSKGPDFTFTDVTDPRLN